AGVPFARLREGEDDRHQVVPRLLLKGLDPWHGHGLRRGFLPDLGRGLGWDQADLRLRPGERRLDVQEALEPGALLEDPLHLRTTVPEVDGAEEGHASRRRKAPTHYGTLGEPSGASGVEAASVGSIGRRIVNVDPRPGSDATSIVPSWASTTCFVYTSPRPSPSSRGFV